MREIKSHQINECNSAITIEAAEADPKTGGCHAYFLTVAGGECTELQFQNGPIQEVGVNGLTNEALIAVVMDRLEGFQQGPFACAENLHALTHLGMALGRLHDRTKARTDRGVEGTHEP